MILAPTLRESLLQEVSKKHISFFIHNHNSQQTTTHLTESSTLSRISESVLNTKVKSLIA